MIFVMCPSIKKGVKPDMGSEASRRRTTHRRQRRCLCVIHRSASRCAKDDCENSVDEVDEGDLGSVLCVLLEKQTLSEEYIVRETRLEAEKRCRGE